MTAEEQMQANALAIYFEHQCGNLAREGANMAAAHEARAQELAAVRKELESAQARIKQLETTATNVVPD